jgi:hypothetical protein
VPSDDASGELLDAIEAGVRRKYGSRDAAYEQTAQRSIEGVPAAVAVAVSSSERPRWMSERNFQMARYAGFAGLFAFYLFRITGEAAVHVSKRIVVTAPDEEGIVGDQDTDDKEEKEDKEINSQDKMNAVGAANPAWSGEDSLPPAAAAPVPLVPQTRVPTGATADYGGFAL